MHNAVDAATLSFDGKQHFRVSLLSPSRSEAEDWRLRFRTHKPSGLLFTTVTEGSHYGRVELGLDNGKLRLTQFAVDRPKVGSSFFDQVPFIQEVTILAYFMGLAIVVHRPRIE